MSNDGLPEEILELGAAKQGQMSEAFNMQPPTIKGLFEATGVSEEVMDELRVMRAENGMRLLATYKLIVERGGTIHAYDQRTKTKNRVANKRARAQRKVNRHG